MEIVEWISAILVTLVIKISWTLRQTMGSMEHTNNNSRNNAQGNDSLYYTAYIEADHSEEVNENQFNANLERSLPSTNGHGRKSLVTSTPQAKNPNGQDVVSPGYSYIEEAPKEQDGATNSTPVMDCYERELIYHFSMIKMPTEEDANVIRTTFARGKISPETELKYRQFLQSPISTRGRHRGRKVSQRKNIRL